MTESNLPPPDPSTTPAPPPPSAAPMEYATASGYPGPYVGPEPDQNAKTMGMLCHIAGLAGYIIPLGNVIGPLIVWQVKKKEHPFIDDQGKESLNFQITVTIAAAISAALICVVVGFFLLIAVGIAALVLLIIAGVKANQGIPYRYPMTLRLVK